MYLKTNFRDLDRVIKKIEYNDLILLEGSASEVNTFILSLIYKLSVDSPQKIPVLYFYLEDKGSEIFKSKDNPIYIENGIRSVEELKEKAEKYKKEKAVKLIIVNNIFSLISNKELKNLAVELNIPVLATVGIPNFSKRKLSLLDFKEKGISEKYADIVLFIQKEGDFAKITVIKNKYGSIGIAELFFNKETNRYENPPKYTPVIVFAISNNSKELVSKIKKEINFEKEDKNFISFYPIDKENEIDVEDLFRTTYLMLIISEFSEDWQNEIIKKIINRTDEKAIKSILVTINEIPENLKDKVYTAKLKDKKEIILISKLILGLIYIPGLICVDYIDLENFLEKGSGKLKIFIFDTDNKHLSEFEKFLKENLTKNEKNLLIIVDISPDASFLDCNNVISIVKKSAKHNNSLFGCWLNYNFSNGKIRIYGIEVV